jgi:rhodanese-related sulfurtransferase
MIDNRAQPTPPTTGCQFCKVLREAAWVGVLGVALAFLANQISPRGLSPARNYFPGDIKTSPLPTPPAPAGANAQPASPSEDLAARFKKNGLQLLDRGETEKLFRDPRLQENLIMFVDARDEDHYREGHIPGAFEFYPYHPEKYLEDVLAPSQVAGQIIVYCTGGDCEDSESAALFLRDSGGVPGAKLFIYGGGMTDWEAAKLPVESGPRNSGDIRNPAP